MDFFFLPLSTADRRPLIIYGAALTEEMDSLAAAGPKGQAHSA